MDSHAHTQISEQMWECIQECQSCYDICLETTTYCLHMGGEHARPDHIRLLTDCAEICQTSANFMLRSSDLHTLTCGICAEVCDHCAETCERFSQDAMMQQCAEMCRNCAKSCREMASSL